MDFEVLYDFENEQQLWNELEEVVSRDCATNDLIDDALRSFLIIATKSRAECVNSEDDTARCSYILFSSSVFEKHEDYVRRQIVHCLLQDDDSNVLFFVATFLLFDVRETEATAELLNAEGAFTRLVQLISGPQQNENTSLHRMLMELLYEMSRIQRIGLNELVRIDDTFVCQLFGLIEELSADVNDPYHYPIIRVILVLNEQYMVSAHDPNLTSESRVPVTNKVIKVIASKGNYYKTFGENIILLLNRESETSLQLLTLKLLYLLFTTPSTQEYFYTNDLRVLVDILIRNLLDLPSGAAALRHTYLRVLYPLLANTQLKQPPHYKCQEIRKLFAVLAGTRETHGPDEEGVDSGVWSHFEEADETTKRLVSRCQSVMWLQDPETTEAEIRAVLDMKMPASPLDAVSGEKVPPAPPVPRKLRKRNMSKAASGFLAPQLESARESALSVLEVAAQREKPGVMTPSRRGSLLGPASKREKPIPPKTRRSPWSRRAETAATSAKEKGLADPEIGADAKEPSQTEDSTKARIAASELIAGRDRPELTKKPPPAPKARRWRGRLREKEDEGGGIELRADATKTSPIVTMPTQKTLSGSETRSPGASVAEALSSAQAEAVDGISEALERANLSVPSADIKTVLAPPSPAPPRGVPGPTFTLERSPFIGDEEDG